jgi:hypothetical protein
METTSSPLPQGLKKEVRPSGIVFPLAIKAVIEGKKIFKLEWEDKGFYGFLNGEFLSLHKPDGKNYQWIVSEADLKGEDWIIID